MFFDKGHGAHDGAALDLGGKRRRILLTLTASATLALAACGPTGPAATTPEAPTPTPTIAGASEPLTETTPVVSADVPTPPAEDAEQPAPATGTEVAPVSGEAEPQPAATQEVDRSQPAAVVNDEEITFEQLDTILEGRYGSQTLDELITETVIRQEMERQNIQVSEQEVEAELQEAREAFGGQDLAAVVRQQYGISLEDFTERVRLQLGLEKLLENRVEITDQDLQQFYEQNKDQFTSPVELRLARVNAASREQAEQAARALAGENANIGQIVERYAPEGAELPSGDLGFQAPQSIDPNIGQVALGLQPGRVSPPIDVGGGNFAVVKVLERRGGEAQTLDQVRDQVTEAVRSQKLGEVLPGYISELRSRANIENQLPLPAAQPAEPPAEEPPAEAPPALETPQG